MQINFRPDGSGVVHKITGNFKGRASGYFQAGAVLVDAEIIRNDNTVHPVKMNGPVWNDIQQKGKNVFRSVNKN